MTTMTPKLEEIIAELEQALADRGDVALTAHLLELATLAIALKHPELWRCGDAG